ncbi:MAG: TetR/AcrR family transcriptional regulator, partial [Acidimicrobiales bacterium]
VQRGRRNRQAVIDALLDLCEEGDIRPGAAAIAQRAGLATRSVFHHFDDLESLLADAIETQSRRHWHVLGPVDPALPLSDRVEAVISQRACLFERIGHVRRAGVAREHESANLARHLARSRRALAAHLRENLSPEIKAISGPARSGLEAMASWEAWESLRANQSLAAGQAEAAVVRVVLLCLTSGAIDAVV